MLTGVIVFGIIAASGPLANPKPGVIPTLKEWEGGVGRLNLTSETDICLDGPSDKELHAVAVTFQSDLKEVLGFQPKIRQGAAQTGDILLRRTSANPKLGQEGYRLRAATTIRIEAPTRTGVFYGTRSLLQMVLLSEDKSVPKGEATDWPDHQVRGLLLDVGRKYFTPSFLERYVKFLSFYKMNDLQIHLNDNEILHGKPDGYSAFRLQSKRHPKLTATDGSYSYQDIQRLQNLADQYSVTITPEIDAPAHSLAFTKYRPDLASKKYGKDHLDLSNPDSQKLINEVWEEFIPWFRAESMHIGADEYSSDPAAHQDYKNYINRTAAFIKSKGKKVRMWGGLKVGGGAEGVDRDIVVNLWYPGYHDPIDAVNEGYKIINTHDGYLYIVPFAGYYYHHLNTKFLYESWLPNDFGGGRKFPYQDPSVLGGMFAVWNDKVGFPYTEEDVHDLVLPAMPTVAEKLWSGPTEGKRTYTEFESNFKVLGDGPGVKFKAPPILRRRGNLAHGLKVDSSEKPAGDFGAINLVDSRPPTRWIVDGKKKQWVQIDLIRAQEVGRVTLRWAPDEHASSYSIQTSTDGIKWVEAHSTKEGKGGIEEVKFPPRYARFLRLELDEPGRTKSFSLFEFEIYRG